MDYPRRTMTEKPKDEPTQMTPTAPDRERLGLPGEGGEFIPVPTRKDVFRDLERAARPSRGKGKRRPKE